MAGDEYIPCVKCDVWVPHYAKEIHMAECHELALRKFSHPYITSSSLFGQVILMGRSDQFQPGTGTKDKDTSETVKSTAKNKKSVKTKSNASHQLSKTEKLSSSRIGNESQVAEPEWLQKVLPSLQYRMVVMNEKDLIRCDITAYSPVQVKLGNVSCGFLAVPDEGVRIGHTMLHQGSRRYLPELRDGVLLRISRIDCVRYIDELELVSSRTFPEEDKTYYERQVKAFLYSSFPLGSPFTVNIGCKIYLPSPQSYTTFTVQSYKLPEPLNEDGISSYGHSKEDQDLTSERSDILPSQLTIINEHEGSLSSIAEQVSKLQISTHLASNRVVEETINITNAGGRSIWTSTPKKRPGTNNTQNNALFSSKTISKDISAIATHVTEAASYTSLDKLTPWVRVGRKTKVTLQSEGAGKGDVVLSKAVIRREEYCKDQTYSNLKKIVGTALQGSGISDSPLLGRWSGVLLYGPPGTGKTLMVQEAAQELGVPLLTLTLAGLSKSSRSEKEYVQYIFNSACQRAPSVLFIDEVESICPATDSKTQADRTLTPFVLKGIQTLQDSSRPVFLVATTCQPSRVSSKLRSPGRLERELMVPLPDAKQRQRILKQLLSTHRHDLCEDDITSIAKRAYGFSGADLSVLIRCAWLACVKRVQGKEELKLSRGDVCVGMQNIVPTMLRHNYSAVSMVKWIDIWGYEDIKRKLQRNIGLYTLEPKKHPLKGLLLYGPPGCSKTMFVRALVHETSYSFFPLKCSNLLSKYVGETEKTLSQVFMRAEQAAPSVVFMDEVDSLCGERAGAGSLVSELLSLMAQTAVQRSVMVIGATNRPHAVDEALLRPGFLEQVIHVDLPDFNSRCAIWRGILEGVPQDDSLNITKLSEATAGYSGAEIVGVYQEAAFTALQKYIKECDAKPTTPVSPCPILLNEDLLINTITALPPRTPSSLIESITSFTSQRKDCLLR